MDENLSRKPNQLIKETSPYLLQHAYNPVNWYPWGEEALQTALTEDKPIFLSVGYSSCHWCHVMAHESFENDEIAKIMNENFVSIKVDREERPDIDDIYQRACQLTTGTGGWPLSVFLTPTQKPYYVGTYFPVTNRHGLPSFGTILIKLADVYKNRKNEVISSTEEFMQALKDTSMDVSAHEGETLEKSMLDEAAVTLLHMGDPLHGGFGQSPKFPNPSNLLFLLRAYDLSGITKYRDFVRFTADKMAAGGIYDHIGGGFARYSTDQKWLVPHFEKMLYDNALLTSVYSELYQITGKADYLKVVNGILQFVIREMTSSGGGFYSSQDADSEGSEGKFYTWSYKEISEILDAEIFQLFCDYFGITQGGNFEGSNILNIQTTMRELSRRHGHSEEWISSRINDSINKIYGIRLARVRPGTDEKVLTSWNGLMMSGFVDGYRVTGNTNYLEACKTAFEFIENNLAYGGNRLYRVFKNGQAKINGYLDDYGFYIKAILDLFAVDSRSRYLERALSYTNAMIKHFWDPERGDFFFTSDDHEKLILRTKNHYDLAIPSGNSVAAANLLRLHYYTQEQDYLIKATKLIKLISKSAIENPFGFGQLLSALYLKVKSPVEICIVRRANATNQLVNSSMAQWLNRQFIPNSISAVIEEGLELERLQKYSYFKGKVGKQDIEKVSEYSFVCQNFTCSVPIYSAENLEGHVKNIETKRLNQN